MEDLKFKKFAEFYDACTDLINAKLILADAKIGAILKCITESPELFATVGECLINFNFDNEFSKAQVKNEMKALFFQLPEEDSKVIALVYGILSECDTHQLDLHQFIRDFFITDDGNMSYGFINFVQSVVYPFRDILCRMVGFLEQEPKQEEEQEEEQEEQSDQLSEFFDNLTRILTQIKEAVLADRKVKYDRLEEINITIDALLQAVDIRNLKIINALLISLNNLIAPIKSIRFYNQELQDCLLDFYEG